MATANPKLTEDIELALSASDDGAIQVEGVNGATYWLLTPEAKSVREQVLEGVAEADRGEVEPWDADEIKRLGRQRVQEQRKR